jgi:hypothetical protein
MAIDATDWTIDRATGNIRYTGDDHTGTAPTYVSVIDFHRWLQDLADDEVFSAASGDELDIIDQTPSDRSTDNIVTLINGFNIDDASAEHIFDGSIIQGTVGVDRVEYDGIVNFGNPEVIIQVHQGGAVLADDWWNYSEGGTHTGAADASVLTDSGKTWTTDEWVGYFIYNTTDGSFGEITANTSTTITATLQGGTEDDWDNADAYKIAKGINSDTAQGISHRFMMRVHDFVGDGGDIDGRRLIGTNRRWTKTYGEFKINGTANGNNVFALGDASDLNNSTAYNTVSGWTTITNTTAGYVLLDVDNDTVNEAYYSEWNRATFTINQFYERMKFISTDGSGTTLYGLNGELFRGITHQLDVDGGTGTWGTPEHEEITWGTGATAGTGRLLAVDNKTGTSTTLIWFQLISGVVPGDNETITGTTSLATAVADTSTGSLTERPISAPFVGVSTGSALIGSYGLSLETADLGAADTVFDLTNTAVTPPNNVTFTVSGLVSGEDRVLVTNNSAGDIDFTQMATDTTLSGPTETAVSINPAPGIPADTPSSGTIRIERDDGAYSRHPFSARDTSTDTFTITSHDFSTNNATSPANVFISYIDKLAGAADESFTTVYDADRTLFVRVRDGGTAGDLEGIKTAETTGVLGTNGGSVTINRISDV